MYRTRATTKDTFREKNPQAKKQSFTAHDQKVMIQLVGVSLKGQQHNSQLNNAGRSY